MNERTVAHVSGRGDGTGRKPAPPVEAVRRALRVMECFGPDHTELGVTEIAQHLNLHKSTVHRVLSTLQLEGFLYQVESGRYALSWKVLQLSAAVEAHRGIHSAALQVLRPLVDKTGETAHLAILDKDQVLYVEKVESTNQLRMPSAVGRHIAVHATALGKALLANLEPDEARMILYRDRLPRFTDSTITDPDVLLKKLAAVREQGFAVDEEETEQGLCCVAAPVRDDQDRACAAISIAGPASRIRDRIDHHASAVRKACVALSDLLGPDVQQLRTLNPDDTSVAPPP